MAKDYRLIDWKPYFILFCLQNLNIIISHRKCLFTFT